MKRPALIDTDRLAQTDPDAAALDAAYRRMHDDPRVQVEHWEIERVTTDDACAARLNEIARMPDAYINSIQLIEPDTYVVLWYRYVTTEATR